ncbi:xanthine dehydrogenase family protein molybdopterin-binding subunit [Alteromonas pelagimontana]|uniref:Xanthine dehydrogenase family protein molybdopterin-binding subunit n=1 Tax=Alteromonas pelagimontana TaxID=1858656 RepID=A0A6M4MDM2_9ALTE|nr:xanthine dehydrogenase family protein molybdopterin-binding subunit [Alteromonas pelagimontana]QJR81213.1 xanthine dehydrogenase family protein molybdopterin-binding subunit [Alteromonas pelagimontana]
MANANATNAHSKVSAVGQPLNRVDGPLKVQGKATYAAEYLPSQKPLAGWIVGATIPRGTITAIDTTEAEKQAGVKAVLTHLNAPSQLPFGQPEDKGRFKQSRAMLNDAKIRYFGFPVALVIADTLEQARYAASLVAVSTDEEAPNLLTSPEEARDVPESLDGGLEADASMGEIAAAQQRAQSLVNVTYQTPTQVSAAMEPHACVAEFDGTKLHVHMSVQVVASAVEAIATTLKMEPENVVVHSPYVGGGFGSKLGVFNETILACLGALHLNQPVRIALSRRQVFKNAPHRGHSYQHMTLGSDENGALTSIRHNSYMPMARDYQFAEPTGAGARSTYRADAISSTHRVKVVDSPLLDSTRAPGDAIGSLAFESAIDEVARKSNIDPLTFRINNMPDKHPVSGKPFSSHALKQCFEEGAKKFGWAERQSSTNGNKRRGFGVASAVRLNMITPSAAQLSLTADGSLKVSTDMTDIGTGTYTILTQIVSDYFGIDTAKVTVDLGHSTSPASSGSGGSFGASSSGSSVLLACEKLAQKVCQLSGYKESSAAIRFADERIVLSEKGSGKELAASSIATLIGKSGKDKLSVEASIAPGDDHDNYAQFSTGAQFAEVEVDTVTGEIRVIRQLGVFSAGKILNHKTATSQLGGGMIWGAGYALMENLVTDQRDGSFINCDFAEYHIPVNRDIGDIEVHFIEEPDYKASKLGSKGIGELGITGSGAAIANAVTDAIGVRFREFPITLDKVLCNSK